MKQAVKLGLIYAAVSIVISLCIYLIDPTLMFTWKLSAVSTIVSVALIVILGRRLLRDEQGLLSYGEAVKYIFVAYLIALAIGSLFNVAMYGSNEQMKQEFEQYIIKSQETGIKMGMKMVGESEARAQEEIEQMKEKYANGELEMPHYAFSASQLPMMFLTSSIISLFMSLILALFVRKKA